MGVPGGTFGEVTTGGGIGIADLLEVGFDIRATDLCFIPTVSALDIQGATSDGYYINDDFLAQIGNSGQTPFTRVIAESEPIDGFDPAPEDVFNNGHVAITRDNASFLISELIGNGDLTILNDPTSTFTFLSTFNYGDSGLEPVFALNPPPNPNGTETLIIGVTDMLFPSDAIVSEGIDILVNADDIIGYTNSMTNPANLTGTNIVVETKEIGCISATTATFESGSSLIIGDNAAGNTAQFAISDGHTVIYEGGSTVAIDDGSTLIIRDGGTMVLEDASNITISGTGTLVVEEGGLLIINGEPNFDFVDEVSQLQVYGGLQLNTTEISATGTGAFVWKSGDITCTESSLEFTRNGDLSHKLLILHSSVEFPSVNITVDRAWVHGATLGNSDAGLYTVRNSKITATLAAENVNDFTILGTEFDEGFARHYGGSFFRAIGNNQVHSGSKPIGYRGRVCYYSRQ